MPAVFVHGVPETATIWDGVISRLSRKDAVAVSLPGFGTNTPDGFGATKEEYLAWLIREVEKIGEPVDIVGHDWGALLTARLVCVRSDLVRTWTGGGGGIDEAYVWHPMARMWQTPGLGEQVMAGVTPGAVATALVNEGVPEDAARAVDARVDDRMKACILSLYRSAVDIGKEWGPDLDRIQRPGLLIWGANDPYMGAEFGRRMAQRTRAEFVLLEDTSHWWPLQRPAEAAAALEEFWGSV